MSYKNLQLLPPTHLYTAPEKSTIRTLRTRIEQQTASLDWINAEIIKVAEKLTFQTNLYGELEQLRQSNSIKTLSHADTFLKESLEDLQTQINAHTRAQTDRKNEIEEDAAILLELQEQLACYAIKQKTISVADILAPLRAHPSLIQTGAHRPKMLFPNILRFAFHPGIIATVNYLDRVPGFIRTNGSDPIQLRLGAIRVHVNLDTTAVTLSPIGEGMQFSAYSGRASACHPHALSRVRTCLGDFGAVLSEALASWEFGFVVDIIEQFLSQINAGDPAGARWKTPFLQGGRLLQNSGSCILIKRDCPAQLIPDPEVKGCFLIVEPQTDNVIGHFDGAYKLFDMEQAA